MDTITNEARLDPFKIDRTVALRILLCNSISQLRSCLSLLLRRAIGFLHPRNTQGILAAMMLMAFLLRRGTDVRSRAESAYRRKFWRNMMRAAVTYEEWAHAARMLDRENAARGPSKCDLYDEEIVRNKLQELRQRREEGSLRDIVFCMRADLLRNLGDMCNPQLHKGRLQVPKLIKEYIDEVSTQLKLVCNSDSEELLLEQKLAFVHETRHSFGRTALLLSGGASLGAFHIGVVKTLVEHKLLPRIIAGSSVGSIICAIVATRSWPELENFFEDSWHSLLFFDQMGGIFTVVKRVMTHGAIHELRQLQKLLRHLTSNLTFQEAYDVTGRILGITVCSPRKHESPRCLNYLTSPHVVIWSAVTASCGFPGLSEAQELMAKDRFGEIVPFHASFSGEPEKSSGTSSNRRWRNGSLESDLPTMQLKELFNANHFIVSQANPHIALLLRLKELVRAYGGNFAAKLAHLAEMEIKHRCNQILELGFPLWGLAKLFAQEWEGDVTVIMPATLVQYLKIIRNPSYMELQKVVNQGRRCTWEKLSAIKANCAIELALDESVALLNDMKLKRSVERAASSHGHASTFKFSASRRIPSWNCIARENSSGSLDEESFVDTNTSNHQGASHVSGPLSRGGRSQISIHDVSDSESENIDLNSWTRSGGPLMRTASANKFINFMHNLEICPDFISSQWDDEVDGSAAPSNSIGTRSERRDSCYNNSRVSTNRSSVNSDSGSRESVSRFPMASTRILVAEGDLLQPEKIHDGIVLSIVRRNDLSLAHRNNDSEQQQSSSTEVDVEVMQIENGDASSTSDYGDNNGIELNCTTGASGQHVGDSSSDHEVVDI